MKCFIVINQLNDPIFLDSDEEFAKYLKKRAVDLRLLQVNQESCEAVDAAVVMQLFSPLVLSQVALANQVKNPCTSIVCPSGLLLVFRKVDDIQYIAINGDKSESADFLERKILVFVRVTKFLFGPVYTEISNCSSVEREARWTFLRSILNTWIHMAKTDQTFLVEALERLHVNQLVSEKCVGLLEKTVRKVQAKADSPTQHAFLLVNTKLLALYSQRSSYELQPADILLTILLAKAIFPSKDGLEDLLAPTMSYPPRQRQHEPKTSRRETKVAEKEEKSEGEEEYHSAPTTPSGARSQSPGNSTDPTVGAHPTPTTDYTTAAAGDVASGSTAPDGANKDSGDGGGDSRSREEGTSSRKSGDGGRHSVDSGGDEKDRRSRGGSSNAVGDGSGATGHDGRRGVSHDGGGDGSGGGNGDGDGGLERMVTQTDGQASSDSTLSMDYKQSGNSSVVETDKGYPPLSTEGLPTGAPYITKGLLQGAFLGDIGHKSHSSSTDGKHSASGRGSATPSDHSSVAAGDLSTTTGTRSRSGTSQSLQSSSQPDPDTHGYWPHTVFLQTPTCQYSPHALHCAQILPGITLVVVSQRTGYATADPLCQVFSIVQDLLQGRRNKLSRAQGVHVHDVIAGLLTKVQSGTRKFRGRVHSSCTDLLSRWEKSEMREKLISYLMQDEHLPMSADLEAPLIEFNRRQKDLFQQLFLTPKSGSGEVSAETGRAVVSKMKVKLQQELMDYRDYLSVKAQRNITMTSYLDDFPGLIHFIYVDRQYHQMTAPSMNVVSQNGKTDGTLFLKEKIWEMYGYMMKKLKEGYTSVLTRNGDFYFSYFLWFEDNMGNPLPVQEPYKPSLETPCPGTLTGNFYRRLRRQCFPQKVDGSVHCYEMFLMHVGLVTPRYAAAHCQKLARKLWEMSGEAFTPVNLL